MDDNKFWAIFWTIAAVVVLCFGMIISSCQKMENEHIQKMSAMGYEQRQVPTTYNWKWVKSDNSND